MSSIGYTIPYVVSLILNDPQISLKMKEVPQSHKEMEVDLESISPAVQELRKETSPQVVEEVFLESKILIQQKLLKIPFILTLQPLRSSISLSQRARKKTRQSPLEMLVWQSLRHAQNINKSH